MNILEKQTLGCSGPRAQFPAHPSLCGGDAEKLPHHCEKLTVVFILYVTHTHTMHTEHCFVRMIMSRRLRDLFASSLFNYVSLGTSLNYFVYFINFKIKILWIAYYYTKACSLKVCSISQNCANTRYHSFPFLAPWALFKPSERFFFQQWLRV